MTRPMPEPPLDLLVSSSIDDPLITFMVLEQDGRLRKWRAPRWSRKHLTDAECAAHYWRAVAERLEFDVDVHCGYEAPDDTLEHRAEVWERFKDTPHALEATP